MLVRRRVSRSAGHLERAFALFQPGRDDDFAFSFGVDPGVAVMANLALVLWPLGEVDRAISFIGACRRGSRESPILTHSRLEDCTRPCSN